MWAVDVIEAMPTEDRLDAIERRLRELEDREAIHDLQYEYAYAVDQNDWEAFLAFFTDDASIEFPEHSSEDPAYHGPAELRKFCTSIEEGRRFMAHMLHNGVVEVDGDTAQGEWYFEVPEVVADGTAVWVQGRYEADYKRIGDDWRFARLRIHLHYSADYETGWADEVVDD